MEVEREGCCLVELGSRFEIRCASTASKRRELVGLRFCVVKKTSTLRCVVTRIWEGKLICRYSGWRPYTSCAFITPCLSFFLSCFLFCWITCKT